MRQTARAQDLLAALAEAGTSAKIVALDVEDQASVDRAFAEVAEREGRLDVLVNNAGLAQLRGLEQQSMDDVARIFNINCFGVIRCIKAALPIMRPQKKGHIVTVTSVGGLVGQPLAEVYCASKFAVEGLVEALSTYLEPVFGIRSTLIEPAGIKSRMTHDVLGDLNLELPLRDVYGPVAEMYRQAVTSRGSFEASAQTPAEIAALVLREVNEPSGALRVLTSPVAKALANEKIAGDPDGSLLQKKVRKILLGLP
jgi:NAD(P)-dependent dehydrogenase (short-subunit alcohol dehydrogenase family)